MRPLWTQHVEKPNQRHGPHPEVNGVAGDNGLVDTLSHLFIYSITHPFNKYLIICSYFRSLAGLKVLFLEFDNTATEKVAEYTKKPVQ